MEQTKNINISKEINNEVEKLLNGIQNTISNLAERWEDEKRYEDFSNYKKTITKELNSLGYDNVVQITKKFKIRVESKLYKNVYIDIILKDTTIEAKVITFKDEPILPKQKSEEPKPTKTKEPKPQTKEPQVETFPDDEVDQDELTFEQALGKLQMKHQEKLQKAMEKLNLTTDKPVQLRKAETILKELPGNSNYVIIDTTKDNTQFELTNKDFSIVAKSKSCGTWKSIVNNPNIYVYEF